MAPNAPPKKRACDGGYLVEQKMINLGKL